MDADNSVHEQNHTSFNPKTDKIGLKSSTSVNKGKTPFEKHTKTFLPLREEDMDVENSDFEQNHTSFKPRAEKLGRKEYTTLKKAKKPLEKHTKTSLPLSNEGHIDDHGQLEQKQNKLLSEPEVVNRARQVNLAAAKNAVTTKRKSAIVSSHASDHDMDDNNSGYEQTHSSCHPKPEKIRRKILTTVKKAKKPLEENAKISSAKGDDDMDVDYSVHEQNHTSCKTIRSKADKIEPKNSINVKKAKKPMEKHRKTSLPLRDKVEDSDDDGNDEQEQHKKTRTTGRPVEKSETTTSKQNTKHVQKSSSKFKHAKEEKKYIAKEQHVDKPSSHRREGATVSVEEVVTDDQRHEEDIKNTTTSSQPVKSNTDDENKNDEYVYRVLRIGESFREGIHPKDVNSNVSIEDHVLQGTYHTKSRFVSCSKTIDGVNALASRSSHIMPKRDVVKININKLDPKEVAIIDLTVKNTRDQHLQHPTALLYAQMYEEVILEPKICIPSECIEKIGEVHQKTFYFTK